MPAVVAVAAAAVAAPPVAVSDPPEQATPLPTGMSAQGSVPADPTTGTLPAAVPSDAVVSTPVGSCAAARCVVVSSVARPEAVPSSDVVSAAVGSSPATRWPVASVAAAPLLPPRLGTVPAVVAVAAAAALPVAVSDPLAQATPLPSGMSAQGSVPADPTTGTLPAAVPSDAVVSTPVGSCAAARCVVASSVARPEATPLIAVVSTLVGTSLAARCDVASFTAAPLAPPKLGTVPAVEPVAAGVAAPTAATKADHVSGANTVCAPDATPTRTLVGVCARAVDTPSTATATAPSQARILMAGSPPEVGFGRRELAAIHSRAGDAVRSPSSGSGSRPRAGDDLMRPGTRPPSTSSAEISSTTSLRKSCERSLSAPTFRRSRTVEILQAHDAAGHADDPHRAFPEPSTK